MLQAAVQSLHWTYTLFWKFSPQQRVLKWSDGFYNGEIKVRRTVEAMDSSSSSEEEEASLQRTNQLRDLYYDLLLSDGSGQGDIVANEPPATPRPWAALSPEDLSESEWYYLMCVSFSFPPGVGLPGKAYAKEQHVWLEGANEADTKIFSRAILAKTVVCIPLLDGVVELGTTDMVQENINFINHVKSFFIGDHHTLPPKHALSENSASNPILQEPQLLLLDSETATTVPRVFTQSNLMELVMAEDSPAAAGSPDDGSYLLDSGLGLLPLEPALSVVELLHGECDNSEAETSQLCMEQEGHTHYSKTVSTILEGSSGHGQPDSLPSVRRLLVDSFQSAFARWSNGANNCHEVPVVENPQRLLKNILFRVPYLHGKQKRHNNTNNSSAQTLEQLDLISSHVAAERRRREKLNEKFMTLRSLVPYVTKMDKASILGDTIEYVKQLHEKVKKLEEEDEGRRSGKKRKERAVEVSVIEGEVLLEVECVEREGLLLDLMKTLEEVGIEVTGVKSSFKGDGDERVVVVELRGKVKKIAKRKNKISIVEVKKVLHNTINPHHHPLP
ncbi:hypothetical protein PIB30_045681 [Stylosanthes scabra]|uniref:BHLH domain-containing protein n=1 Tax=Stylosanthes scabra TaxID=79078 RepID=A0ABU6SG36_9FABA|nr:hypothetical protein [Stylosanthes scabra]